MSRWDTFPLSKDQQLYAAIDVYVNYLPSILNTTFYITHLFTDIAGNLH